MKTGLTAGRFDIICQNNATFELNIPKVKNKNTGVLIDLTGYTAKMQVRANKSDAPAILTLTTDVGGGITLGGALSTIKIYIKATETSNLPAGIYYYDFQLIVFNSTLNENIVYRLLEGTFSVIEEVTQ